MSALPRDGTGMSDGQAQPQSEPSMEEILASIRRIISEDEQEPETPAESESGPEAAAPPEPPEPPEPEPAPEPPAAPEPEAAPKPAAAEAAEPDAEPDVLELTDIVEEAAEPAPEPEPPPPPPPVAEAQPEPAPMPEPEPEPEEPVEVELREPPPPPREPEPEPEPEGSRLVGPPAAQSSMDSLSALAAVMERQRTGPAIGDGGRTIEDLVKEVMRPMIREWLDANLPALVERLVDKEIGRIARRAEDAADQ